MKGKTNTGVTSRSLQSLSLFIYTKIYPSEIPYLTEERPASYFSSVSKRRRRVKLLSVSRHRKKFTKEKDTENINVNKHIKTYTECQFKKIKTKIS